MTSPTDVLAPLLALPGVTDVLVHDPASAWIDRGGGLERRPLGLAGPEEVRELAVALAASAGRRLDDAEPTVDARLADGTRLHAVIPPVADGCTAISLRRVREVPFALADLVAAGMLGRELADLLAALVRARVPLLVSGGTGAGKTTLLASLLALVEPTERIVLIEEAGEIAVSHPHVVRLVERRPNVEGAGGIALARLVREALRMRPDRIVLGECRGAELREVLAAANTGHRGSLTTVHANSAADVPARLASLAMLAGLTAAQLASQAGAAFAVVVHVERGAAGRRVAEVARLEAAGPELRVATAAVPDGASLRFGPAWMGVRALAEGRTA
ncbi:TadA family conjugal transfer-associated ATPase [Demequina gelatinilytica]|uniref:TadA family conjugal transfer-associated ATPase n=1 Tax=Demequina gelatinilytica TaxID=1638980 RepID=UPI00078602C4|nr:TadA family conjugal transfer-associated ATPase [Demequina gelatinilytica]